MATTRLFRPGQTCAIAGVSRDMLKTWITRDVIPGLSRKRSESGERARFTFNDLLKICAWAEVNRVGVSVRKIRRKKKVVVDGVAVAKGRKQKAGVGERLVDAIEFELKLRADGRDLPRPRFLWVETFGPMGDLVSDMEDDGRGDLAQIRHGDLRSVIEAIEPDMRELIPSVTKVVVDVDKLWSRIQRSLSTLPEEST